MEICVVAALPVGIKLLANVSASFSDVRNKTFSENQRAARMMQTCYGKASPGAVLDLLQLLGIALQQNWS